MDMALIKCPECGKNFSDKAPGCPECGCPTKYALKGSSSAVGTQKRISAQEADEKILAEVKRVKAEASRAESLFDSRNRAIQRKASYSIDLYGGNATSRVVEIQADAREACDDLYTTYQSLVESLDCVCRPLLDYSPGGASIKAVLDTIQYLNEESKIECNFTASFNGTSLGNVANGKYVVRISNKMIQRFWETTYEASPYAAEQKKKRREAAEQARIRQEEERKRKAEEKRLEDARRAEEQEKQKKHRENITSGAQRRVSEYKKELNQEVARQTALLKEKIDCQIVRFTEQLRDCEQTAAGLGLFSFGEKKKLREQAELLGMRISRLQDPQLLAGEEKKMKTLAAGAVDAYRSEMDAYLAKRFPGRAQSGDNREAAEYADTAYPEPPAVDTLFAGSK